jgi:hypothetical protein
MAETDDADALFFRAVDRDRPSHPAGTVARSGQAVRGGVQ